MFSERCHVATLVLCAQSLKICRSNSLVDEDRGISDGVFIARRIDRECKEAFKFRRVFLRRQLALARYDTAIAGQFAPQPAPNDCDRKHRENQRQQIHQHQNDLG
jgi:hypothetical protein